MKPDLGKIFLALKIARRSLAHGRKFDISAEAQPISTEIQKTWTSQENHISREKIVTQLLTLTEMKLSFSFVVTSYPKIICRFHSFGFIINQFSNVKKMSRVTINFYNVFGLNHCFCIVMLLLGLKIDALLFWFNNQSDQRLFWCNSNLSFIIAVCCLDDNIYCKEITDGRPIFIIWII